MRGHEVFYEARAREFLVTEILPRIDETFDDWIEDSYPMLEHADKAAIYEVIARMAKRIDL